MDSPVAGKPLTIRLFGRARIAVANAPAAFPPRPGTRSLFVALAFNSQPRERDWLAETIWPDVVQSEARANLRRHVLYVEKWLSDLTGFAGAIVRHGTQLALHADLIEWLDVRAFQAAIDGGRFEEAVEIYSDDLLVDFEESWIATERTRHRARFDEILLALVTSARARGETEVALRYTQIARSADVYNEAWLRTAMRLRYAAGDRAGALVEFEAYRVLVRRELEVEPMPETLMLADSIRRHDEAAVPKLLSFESTSFVGRAAEAADLAALMMRRQVVTIAGAPGIGKSRLAYRCARSLAQKYRDGIFMVSASSATDAGELERSVMRAFTGGEPARTDTLEEVASPLEGIVVLDGCERLLQPCADIVARLAFVAPRLHVVTTSRVPLGIAGEAIYRIGPLQPSDGAQLFLERLQLWRPDAVIAHADLLVVARICSELDGLPLALELAAARARVSTLADVHEDVRNRVLRPGFDVLYAAYASSYRILGDTERAVLRRLAPFIKCWTLPIALAACADIAAPVDVRRAFATLIEHSLVIPPAVSDVSAPYSMLDATRDFAAREARELGETETDARAVAGATARHYVALGARLRGEHAADFYSDIERDRENIDGALTTLWHGGSTDRALAVDLSLAVSRYWADQGFASHGVHWLRKGMEYEEVAAEDSKRLELARVISTLTRNLGDYAASYRDFCELVRLQEAADADAIEIGRSQVMAANAARMMGDFDEALSRMALAQRAFVEHGEQYLAAWAVYAIGTTYLSAGRFREAAAELERATDAFNEIEAIADTSSSIGNLALCHYYEGRLDVALELAQESLSRAKSVGHRYYHAHAALNATLILHGLGRSDEAWSSLLEASDIGRTLNAQDVLISSAEAACAILAASRAADAAMLLGSVDRARERACADRFPVDIPLYDGIVAELHETLGAARFAALRVRGRVTPLRQAVERLFRPEPRPRMRRRRDDPVTIAL